MAGLDDAKMGPLVSESPTYANLLILEPPADLKFC